MFRHGEGEALLLLIVLREDGKRAEDQSPGKGFYHNSRMLHARLPGGIIDRGQHCDSVFLVADVTVTRRHWMAASIDPLRGRDMNNSRGIHVLEDVLWHR